MNLSFATLSLSLLEFSLSLLPQVGLKRGGERDNHALLRLVCYVLESYIQTFSDSFQDQRVFKLLSSMKI
jgi:hypothetical protein